VRKKWSGGGSRGKKKERHWGAVGEKILAPGRLKREGGEEFGYPFVE